MGYQNKEEIAKQVAKPTHTRYLNFMAYLHLHLPLSHFSDLFYAKDVAVVAIKTH